MDNVFFKFCADYWDEIIAFADALYAWFKKIVLDEAE